MGFFDKLKNFGSKIVNGFRKGWDFAKNKIIPGIRKALPIADKIAPYIPGGKVVMDVIHKGDDVLRRVGV